METTTMPDEQPELTDDEFDDGVKSAATSAALAVLDLLVEASEEGNADRVEELADTIRALLDDE